ncbi:hypothetical protein HZC07_03320 [Candidatus Micrarchaeota archaeon]|nr:hypothetical protein [Candidatus Micrarchaeota archaeon]
MKLIALSMVALIVLFGCLDILNPPKKYQCGGIAGLNCPQGYVCIVTDDGVADAIGNCVPANEIEKTCGGVAGIKCPIGYICEINNTNSSDAAGKCIPSPIPEFCGVGQSYEVSSSAGPGCSCPPGFKFDSKIIGYKRTGEVESPILEVKCVEGK